MHRVGYPQCVEHGEILDAGEYNLEKKIYSSSPSPVFTYRDTWSETFLSNTASGVCRVSGRNDRFHSLKEYRLTDLTLIFGVGISPRIFYPSEISFFFE